MCWQRWDQKTQPGHVGFQLVVYFCQLRPSSPEPGRAAKLVLLIPCFWLCSGCRRPLCVSGWLAGWLAGCRVTWRLNSPGACSNTYNKSDHPSAKPGVCRTGYKTLLSFPLQYMITQPACLYYETLQVSGIHEQNNALHWWRTTRLITQTQ